MTDRAYHRNYNRKYYHLRRAEYIRLLGGECVICGSKENLEFDHTIPDTKEFSIGKLMNYARAKVLAELDKCRLLCTTCHKKRTRASVSVEPSVVAAIQRDYATGKYTQRVLAAKYGVHQTTVCKYVSPEG